MLDPELPVRGWLQKFQDNWISIHPNSWVLYIVQSGYLIPFKKLPDFQGVRSTPITHASSSVLLEEVDSLLQKDAIELVPNSPEQGFTPLTFWFQRKQETYVPY